MPEQRDTLRLEAFSDGVFAIAMTLLVIALKVPSHELDGTIGLAQSLIDLWPSYLAFVTSFATVLVIWVHHHWVFALIDKSDHSFLYWNGLLMLFVTLVPFPAALLAEYLLHPQARGGSTCVHRNVSGDFTRLRRIMATRLIALVVGQCVDREKARGGTNHPPVPLWPTALSGSVWGVIPV